MKKDKEEERFVFVIDRDRTVTGFGNVEDAWLESGRLQSENDEDVKADRIRIRVRLRRRTGKYDVVVKVRRAAAEFAKAKMAAVPPEGAQ